jgi:ABC-type Zn uptake system ZnuABC Zn-binding protein ZnuA
MKIIFNKHGESLDMKWVHALVKYTFVVLSIVILAACGAVEPAVVDETLVDAGSGADSTRLLVVATTSIVGDVVNQVGGEHIRLEVLVPLGSDPHTFQPTPQDAALVSDADVLFVNGAGLEEDFLGALIDNAGDQTQVVSVSDGIELLEFVPEEEEHEDEATEGEEHEGGDPHVWMDPNNVMVWVDNIAASLSSADADSATEYSQNAANYKTQLEELDAWIRAQVAKIPAENRLLVTDHQVLGYFADEYGFEQTGTVIQGYSTTAQASAQELAALIDTIERLDVKAVFVGNTVNPNMAEQISNDTGTKLSFFYTGSLSEESGPAASYIDFIHYNVQQIVTGLE